MGYLSKGKPTSVGKLLYLTPEMIVKHYVTVSHIILNYYSFVNNYTITRARVLYILKYSCALTLCSKLRLKTLHKTFAKFGYNLAIRDNKGAILEDFDETKISKCARGFHTADYDPLYMFA
jgi:hypothetical protein